MAVIGWGKPRIFLKDLDVQVPAWKESPVPVENSTQLTPTKGNKMEAKLEGGENEDVRYSKNSYALSYQIRLAKDKIMPITHEDGVVAHRYAVAIQPEDPTVPGVMIDNSVVSVEDAFSTENGGLFTYTHDVLKPESGKQVKWGIISAVVDPEDDSLSVTVV